MRSHKINYFKTNEHTVVKQAQPKLLQHADDLVIGKKN